MENVIFQCITQQHGFHIVSPHIQKTFSVAACMDVYRLDIMCTNTQICVYIHIVIISRFLHEQSLYLYPLCYLLAGAFMYPKRATYIYPPIKCNLYPICMNVLTKLRMQWKRYTQSVLLRYIHPFFDAYLLYKPYCND